MKRMRGLGPVAVFILLVGVGWAAAEGNPARGRASYEHLCALCHGTSGEGDGPAAASLSPKPTNLANKQYLNWLQDDYLKELIKEGGLALGMSPLMPALGGALNDDDVKNVISYVRSLAK